MNYDVGVDIPVAPVFVEKIAPLGMYFPQAAKRLASEINERTPEQVIVVSCSENKSILVTTIQKGLEVYRKTILECNDDFLVN